MLALLLGLTVSAVYVTHISAPRVDYAALWVQSLLTAEQLEGGPVWFAAWVSTDCSLVPVVRLRRASSQEAAVYALCTQSRSVFAISVERAGESIQSLPLSKRAAKWQEVAFGLSGEAQLTACLQSTEDDLQCVSTPAQLLNLSLFSQCEIILGGRFNENWGFIQLAGAQLILGGNDLESWLRASFMPGFYLTNFGVRHHTLHLTPATQSLTLTEATWPVGESTASVSGWFYVASETQQLLTLAIESLTVLAQASSSHLQVCAEKGDHTYCAESVPIARGWNLVQVGYAWPYLEYCTGTIESEYAVCRSESAAILGTAKETEVRVTAGRDCVEVVDLIATQGRVAAEAAAAVLEAMESACVRRCPLRRSHRCAAHWPRSLAITHFSGISIQQYMARHDSKYFTFVNNHAATVYIQFVADSLGGGGDPDIYIYKPWTGGTYDWMNIDWYTSAVTLYPNDSKLPAKGGIKGLYTLKVYAYNGPFSYECRVRIACAANSLASCNCADGSYPNIYTSTCSPCAGGVNACGVLGSLGCLPYSPSTAAPSNTFNCQTCSAVGYTLDVASGNCVACAAVCESCLGAGASQCVTCKSGAVLASGIGTSTCVCADGYYPNTTAANCLPCSTSCLTCVSVSASGCKSCKANTTLAGAVPNSCRCLDGYGGTPDNCQPCHATCLTCSSTTSSSCVACRSVAVLAGAAPNSCICPSGYFPSPDSSNCTACDPHCLSCTGALASQCTACQPNAKLSTAASPNTCVCKDGYYGDSASCQVCDPTCGTCSVSGSSQCDTCKANAALAGAAPNSCGCNSGYYPASTAASCQSCHTTCATCAAAGASSCQSCKSNATLSSGACVCVTHFFPSPTSANCQACSSGCKECVGSAATQCSACYLNAGLSGGGAAGACVCSSGFVPSPGVDDCQPCSSTCSTCSVGGTSGCDSCHPHADLSGPKPNSCVCVDGLYPNPTSQTCQPCDMSCLQCTGPLNTDCSACNLQATLTTVAGGQKCICNGGGAPTTCVVCHQTCATCDGNGPSFCLTCKANAQQSPPATSSYCECSLSFFPSPDASNCVACDQSCQQCVGSAASSCTACFANAALAGSSPNSCECVPGYYPDPTSKTCSACDVTCASCNGGATNNCLSCYTNASKSSNVCTCAAAYFPNPTAKDCSACDDSCATCLGATENDCVSCFSNAKRTSTGPSSSCECNLGYYPNPDVIHCQACHGTCQHCVGTADTQCTQCYANAVLENLVSPGKCVCVSTAFTLSTSATCVMCDSTCKTCSGSASQCTSCYSNAHLRSGSGSPCDCDFMFLPMPDTANCLSCDSTCKTCVTSGVAGCSSCFTSAQLHNAANPSSCECLTAFYPAPTIANCQSCYIACKECLGGGEFECTDCYSDAGLRGGISPNNCLCSQGFYADPSAKTCAACHGSCLSCTGPLSTDCSDCHPLALLSNGVPSRCDCMGQYFPLPDSSNCILCDATCAICGGSGPTKCASCFRNAHLMGPSPNQCKCDDSYYENPTVASCAPCDVDCLQCVGPSSTQCTACYLHAQLDYGLNPSSCGCLDGYYPAPTAATCALCASTCRKCVSGSNFDCYQCYQNAVVEGGFPLNRCVCDVGYFPDSTSANCTPCHYTCLECMKSGPTGCTSCHSFGRLNGDPSGYCDCADGAFSTPGINGCTPCSPSCLTCIAENDSSCTSCAKGAKLSGPSPSKCECSPGFFLAFTECQACNAACATCQEPSVCQSCHPHAVLVDGLCECAEGFYGSARECQQCASGCQACVENYCQQCAAGMFALMGQCFAQCPSGYGPTFLNTCDLLDLTAPQPTLTVTTENNLSVEFSKVMHILDLSTEDIEVTVVDPDGVDVAVEWSRPVLYSSQSMFIALNFETSYLPVGCLATLVLLNASKVVDENDIAVETTSMSAQLHEMGSDGSSGSALMTPAGQSTAAAASGAATSSVTLSVINGNPGLLTTFVNNMQLMSYMGMTKVPLPEDFLATLAAMNMGFILPNPFSSVIRRPEGSQDSPSHVKSYGIDSTLFFSNALGILSTATAVLLSYIPAYLLSKVRNKRVSSYFRSIVPSIKWDTPMKLWLTAYLDIGVFSFLQLTNAPRSVENWTVGINLAFSLAFSLAVLATPFLIWSFLSRNYNLLADASDAQFSRRWGSLTKEFASGNAECLMFYLLFTARRALFTLSLTLLADFPTFTVSFNCCLSLTVSPSQFLAYLLAYRPLGGQVDQASAVVNESAVLLVYISVFAFAVGTAAGAAQLFSSLGIWVARSAIFFNIFVSLYKSVAMLAKVVNLYRRVKRTVHFERFQKRTNI